MKKKKFAILAMFALVLTGSLVSCGDENNAKEPEVNVTVESLSDGSLLFAIGKQQFKMRRVEGGTFLMGAPDTDGEAYKDELPAHSVTLGNYYICETEVTQALWQQIMGENPSSFKGNPLYPVESVSWDECQEFIKKLNEKTKKKFRLPTEAEWEYAARGGKKSSGYKYAGSNDIAEVAWFLENAENQPHIVGTRVKKNELGLFDMSGNVGEWTADRYDSYGIENQENLTNPTENDNCVWRGGTFNSAARLCRVTCRDYYSSFGRMENLGLRMAL